eukprot:1943692-Pyramimonas_sp.AAC.1
MKQGCCTFARMLRLPRNTPTRVRPCEVRCHVPCGFMITGGGFTLTGGGGFMLTGGMPCGLCRRRRSCRMWRGSPGGGGPARPSDLPPALPPAILHFLILQYHTL